MIGEVKIEGWIQIPRTEYVPLGEDYLRGVINMMDVYFKRLPPPVVEDERGDLWETRETKTPEYSIDAIERERKNMEDKKEEKWFEEASTRHACDAYTLDLFDAYHAQKAELLRQKMVNGELDFEYQVLKERAQQPLDTSEVEELKSKLKEIFPMYRTAIDKATNLEVKNIALRFKVASLEKDIEILKAQQPAESEGEFLKVTTNHKLGDEFKKGEWRLDPFCCSDLIAEKLGLKSDLIYGLIFQKKPTPQPAEMPEIKVGDFIKNIYKANLYVIDDSVPVEDGEVNVSYIVNDLVTKIYRSGKLIWDKKIQEAK